MSSDAALNAKLADLLKVMVSRLPPNKKLPVAVVQQLLRGKYGDTYSEAYVQSHEAFIAETTQRLTAEKEKAAGMTSTTTTAATAAGTATEKPLPASSSDDGADDDTGSDDDSEDESDADSESSFGEDDEEEDDDDDDFESEEDSDGDENTSEEETEEPQTKKSRPEAAEAETMTQKTQQQPQSGEHGDAAPPPSGASPAAEDAGGAATISVGDRCKAMAACLRKLSYRVRAPTEAESLEDYLHQFLIVEFQKHGLDPAKYGKSDVKRYKIKREVELLQQDGASLALDRRSRAGRGFSSVPLGQKNGSPTAPNATPTPPASNTQTSMFLDDE